MSVRSARQVWCPACLGAWLLIAACSGGGGGGGGSPASPGVQANTQAITVDAGPARTVDLPFVTVTICAVGEGAICQTIDHVVLDTGSTGLRIVSSVLSPSLALAQRFNSSGDPIVECAQFADGFSWGPLKLADLRIAGQQASSLAVQVIGDPAFPTVPASCSSTGPAKNTVQRVGGNGLLGVGTFRQDCGNACAQSSSPGFYFACPNSGCAAIALPVAQQLQNPVTLFAADNNGVIVDLPGVPPSGATGVAGTLFFGIGTQPNNALGGVTVLTVDPRTGYFTTLYNGRTITSSFLDSGSNGFFFRDLAIPVCGSGTGAAGFYCPASTLGLSATLQGTNGINAAISFSIANAQSLITNNPTFTAFDNLGFRLASLQTFDWGLPFFLGRKVFIAVEGASTPGGPGPYVAF